MWKAEVQLQQLEYGWSLPKLPGAKRKTPQEQDRNEARAVSGINARARSYFADGKKLKANSDILTSLFAKIRQSARTRIQVNTARGKITDFNGKKFVHVFEQCYKSWPEGLNKSLVLQATYEVVSVFKDDNDYTLRAKFISGIPERSSILPKTCRR